MSERVTMPALGESVTEGTVTRWLKNVGDHVEVDEPLLEVSTDKVDTEIPSPVAGTLQEILVQEDDTVPVGADLAVIGDGEAPSRPAEQPARSGAHPEPQAAGAAPLAPEPEPPSRRPGRPRQQAPAPEPAPAAPGVRARAERRPPAAPAEAWPGRRCRCRRSASRSPRAP